MDTQQEDSSSIRTSTLSPTSSTIEEYMNDIEDFTNEHTYVKELVNVKEPVNDPLKRLDILEEKFQSHWYSQMDTTIEFHRYFNFIFKTLNKITDKLETSFPEKLNKITDKLETSFPGKRDKTIILMEPNETFYIYNYDKAQIPLLIGQGHYIEQRFNIRIVLPNPNKQPHTPIAINSKIQQNAQNLMRGVNYVASFL